MQLQCIEDARIWSQGEFKAAIAAAQGTDYGAPRLLQRSLKEADCWGVAKW